MSFFRKNMITNDWVIFAPNRSKRPIELKTHEADNIQILRTGHLIKTAALSVKAMKNRKIRSFSRWMEMRDGRSGFWKISFPVSTAMSILNVE